jgi:Flp pilus assembly protein TadB
VDRVALFLFLSTGAASLFAFLTLSHWISTRAAERTNRERLMLLRKMAEQPAAAEAMRALLRDEDAREQARARQRAIRERRETLQAGVTLLAIGAGLCVFLYIVTRGQPVWAVGILVMLIGAVTAAFAYVRPSDGSDAGQAEEDG